LRLRNSGNLKNHSPESSGTHIYRVCVGICHQKQMWRGRGFDEGNLKVFRSSLGSSKRARDQWPCSIPVHWKRLIK
jgi:hypothetical protein